MTSKDNEQKTVAPTQPAKTGDEHKGANTAPGTTSAPAAAPKPSPSE